MSLFGRNGFLSIVLASGLLLGAVSPAAASAPLQQAPSKLSVPSAVRPADAPTGSISGTVSAVALPGGGNGPYFRPRIDAQSTDPASGVDETTYALSDGSYSLPDIPVGTYRVIFNDQPLNQNPTMYATQRWNDSSTVAGATTVSVTDGGTVTGINATLQIGATIEGTVTAKGSPNTPLAGLEVYGGSGFVREAYTDASGHYSLPAF